MAVVVMGCGKKEASTETEKASGETITFKLALVDPENSNYGKGAQKIAEEVDAATEGKIKIEVNAGGALGGERDTVELAMSNNLDIATSANSVLTNFIPEMGILDQAYLWTSKEQAHAAVDGKLGELIKDKAKQQGLHVIGFMESGFRNTFSVKPIKSIEDFKGVTIRTMENKYHQAAFTAFGAMPVAEITFRTEAVKFFPAKQYGGIDTIKALSAPFPTMRFMPTGGIHMGNIKEFLAFPKIIACGGSWMVNPSDIENGKFDEIANITREAVELVSQ